MNKSTSNSMSSAPAKASASVVPPDVQLAWKNYKERRTGLTNEMKVAFQKYGLTPSNFSGWYAKKREEANARLQAPQPPPQPVPNYPRSNPKSPLAYLAKTPNMPSAE